MVDEQHRAQDSALRDAALLMDIVQAEGDNGGPEDDEKHALPGEAREKLADHGYLQSFSGPSG